MCARLVSGRAARHPGLLLLPAEVRGEGGNRIRPAHLDQVLGERALLIGDGGVALEPLAIDDGVIEARLGALVEEHGVEYFAPCRGQPERHVRDAQDGSALREARLDGPDAVDGLDRRADVVLVARPHWKDEGVEDEVARGEPVLLGEQRVRSRRCTCAHGHRHALCLSSSMQRHHRRHSFLSSGTMASRSPRPPPGEELRWPCLHPGASSTPLDPSSRSSASLSLLGAEVMKRSMSAPRRGPVREADVTTERPPSLGRPSPRPLELLLDTAP